MANITMWAIKKPSTDAMDASKNEASYSTSETTLISEDDLAKIKKDAVESIEKEIKLGNPGKVRILICRSRCYAP